MDIGHHWAEHRKNQPLVWALSFALKEFTDAIPFLDLNIITSSPDPVTGHGDHPT
jgi:hypothetical protein